MCKNDILLQKSAAKVLLFAHTAKLIAQNQPICAHFGRFVQLIWMEIDNNQFIYSVLPLNSKGIHWGFTST